MPCLRFSGPDDDQMDRHGMPLPGCWKASVESSPSSARVGRSSPWIGLTTTTPDWSQRGSIRQPVEGTSGVSSNRCPHAGHQLRSAPSRARRWSSDGPSCALHDVRPRCERIVRAMKRIRSRGVSPYPPTRVVPPPQVRRELQMRGGRRRTAQWTTSRVVVDRTRRRAVRGRSAIGPWRSVGLESPDAESESTGLAVSDDSVGLRL
jgi:hypothetical protein